MNAQKYTVSAQSTVEAAACPVVRENLPPDFHTSPFAPGQSFQCHIEPVKRESYFRLCPTCVFLFGSSPSCFLQLLSTEEPMKG
jgi:hypothetical protein